MNDVAQFSRSSSAAKAPPDKHTPSRRALSRTPSQRPKPAQHYFAFLSYSHADQQVAEWLQEAIEKFRVPKRLVGRLTENGPVPRRLTPIFRDRGELAAAVDLGEEIEEALAGSRFMIVLCSPAAVASRWASKEIVAFKRLHPDGCIFAAIIAGEPFASDIPGRESEECFPPALLEKYDRRGRPTGKRAEPIAADLRAEGDGKQLGLLKIIAGMLDVGLDDLVQREGQRRQKRMALIAGLSILGMVITSGLSVTAMQSRDAARDERREAEGLIGFMLGDLREKLEPVGQLEALDAVGVRALEYYEKQDKTELSDRALAQRSKALTLIGEIAEAQGDMDGALRRYSEALAGTAEALRRSPNDAERIFEHAQNVYWVGSIAVGRDQTDIAARQFNEYKRLAERLVRADPDNPKWRLESVYANSNLGMVEIEQRNYAQAAETYRASLSAIESLVSAEPANRDYQMSRLETVAWLAEAAEKSGDLKLALSGRQRQIELLAPLLAKPRPDVQFQQKSMIGNMALSRHLYETDNVPTALLHSAEAARIGQALTKLDPTNADWMGRSANTQLHHAMILLRVGRRQESDAAVGLGCDLVSRALSRDRNVASWRNSYRRCLALRAELAMAEGAGERAGFLARQAVADAQSERIADPLDKRQALTSAYKLLGDVAWKSGDRAGAKQAWQAGLSGWPAQVALTPAQMMERREMLTGLGARAEAQKLSAKLESFGFRQFLSDRLGNGL